MKELLDWIKDNNIYCTIQGAVLFIEDMGGFLFSQGVEDKIISHDYSLNLSVDEYNLIDADKEIKYIVFKFGNRFYYSDVSKTKKNEYNETVIVPEFNDFINLGKFEEKYEDIDFCNLSIRTGYELLNGSGDSLDYVKKAKFYNHKSIGICEKNTLSGTLPFQLSCEKKGLKSILGETISVALNYNKDKEFQDLYELKLFVKNENGWRNLLRISKAINVDYNGFIPIEELLERLNGLIIVFSNESYLYDNIYIKKSFLKHLNLFRDKLPNNNLDDVYFQINLNEWQDDSLDLDNLERLKHYFDNYLDLIKPVYIEDVFYTEKNNFEVKKILNNIDKKTVATSKEQYFKSKTEIIDKYSSLFSDDKLNILLDSLRNTKEISDKCNFIIKTGQHKLPKYDVKNKKKFYLNLIEKGFQEKIYKKYSNNLEKLQVYLDRVDEENDVIIGANLIDYFLILWDVIDWSKRNNILVGPGRGSAGGSLVAYLLGIIEIDPVQYDLLFERFLNKTRVSGERAKSADSLPDIDVDFEGKRRQDVKRYMENRFNIHNVCSIGTFTRLKTKSAIKDFSRVKGLDFTKVNFATKEIPDSIDFDWSDLFTNSLKSNELKKFVQDNVDICELMKAPLGQPRSKSVHASAVVIVPKEDENGEPMEIYDWMPVKMLDGTLVSEWEGKYTDRAGFLKEDILGIAQLDKFKNVLDLIEKNHNKKIDLNKIKINDKKVYDFFSKGWNEDVFQFGTAGLKNYSARVKPKNIEDLISMNALFRPGPMDSNAHNDFVDFRRGTKKAIIDLGMEIVVKDTQGLYIYQEQVMQAMVVGGLTLTEADQVRTYMKKFDKVNLALFKEKWVKGYIEVLKQKGLKKDQEKYANNVWDKLNAFSSYGFNRSHAAAYSLMGYWSQWLKVNYPLEFWTASLNFADENEQIPNRISEIKKIKNGIKVSSVDINKSDIVFTSDIETKSIYWSLTKIKFVGEVAVKIILEERIKGEFFSLEDFLNRVPKNKVNKKIVVNLIKAGAFDEISSENIPIEKRGQPKHRYYILKEYLNKVNEELPEEILNSKNNKLNWFWRSIQKDLTGFGDINYKTLVKKKWVNKNQIKNYLDGDLINEYIFDEDEKFKFTITAGKINNLKVRSSKRGDFCIIDIENNNAIVTLQLWNDTWDNKKIQKSLLKINEEKSMFAISGEIRFDNYRNKNVFFATDKTKIITL